MTDIPRVVVPARTHTGDFSAHVLTGAGWDHLMMSIDSNDPFGHTLRQIRRARRKQRLQMRRHRGRGACSS